MITADTVKSLLNLKPHPEEGGYFRETYRSPHTLSKHILSEEYQDERSLFTAIYYLLTPDTFSALHRLPTDELFHFYLGDPVEMIQLLPDGTGRTITLGQDITNGMQLQAVVRKGSVAGVTVMRRRDSLPYWARPCHRDLNPLIMNPDKENG